MDRINPRKSVKYPYELKFTTIGVDMSQIELQVLTNPGMFSEIYFNRSINNIYLDSFDYSENVAWPTVKTRIQWFGEINGLIENSFLEFKTSHNNHQLEESYLLGPFIMNRNFNTQTILSALEQSQLPSHVMEQLADKRPAFMNRYRRQYFLSANHHFLITIDESMSYYDLDPNSQHFLQQIKDPRIVIKLKYAQKDDPDLDMIASAFPHKVSGHPNYSNQIKSLCA